MKGLLTHKDMVLTQMWSREQTFLKFSKRILVLEQESELPTSYSFKI